MRSPGKTSSNPAFASSTVTSASRDSFTHCRREPSRLPPNRSLWRRVISTGFSPVTAFLSFNHRSAGGRSRASHSVERSEARSKVSKSHSRESSDDGDAADGRDEKGFRRGWLRVGEECSLSDFPQKPEKIHRQKNYRLKYDLLG